MSPEYWAGFFDGDGYAKRYWHKKAKVWVIAVGLSNNDRAILEIAQAQFGGAISKAQPRANRKGCYQLRFRKAGAFAFLSVVAPHVFVRRHDVEVLIHTRMAQLADASRSERDT